MCELCSQPDQHRDGAPERSKLPRREFLRRAGLIGATLTLGPGLAGVSSRRAGAESRAAAGIGPATGVRTATTGRALAMPVPPMVTRAQWGADESLRTSDRSFAPIQKLIVHHTDTAPHPNDPASDLRAIYKFHIESRDFADIAYNFVIDPAGTIYEGRWARDYAPGEAHTGETIDGLGVVGAHTLNYNTGSCGVALVGDYTANQPTDAAMLALVRVLAWKAGAHGINAAAADVFTNVLNQTSVFPNTTGHRDLFNTQCPGNTFYGDLAGLRSRVLARASYGLIGYRVLTTDGTVATFGGAFDEGDVRRAGQGDRASVAISPGANADSYLVLRNDGSLLGFGPTPYFGGLPQVGVRTTGVDVAVSATGQGYWILGGDGGVYHFGDAPNAGSLKTVHVRTAPKKLRPTPSGQGYWILGADGGIFSFGDAQFFGSVPGVHARTKAVDLAPTPSGQGYWVLGEDGGVFSFGDAQFFGSIPGLKLTWARPARAIVAAFDGGGYHVLANDGGVFSFGNVPFFGSIAGSGRQPAGMAPAIQR